jgi:hypothetical protein
LKIRNLLLLGAGVAVGYTVAKRMNEDDPAIVKGPQRAPARSTNPALAAVSTQAQRASDLATVKSLEAIRKARAAIASRRTQADPGAYEDAAWN